MKTPDLFEWTEFEAERLELALGRLTEILSLETDEGSPAYIEFGKEAAAQLLAMAKLSASVNGAGLASLTAEELQVYNRKLYMCADPVVYETSYLNPTYAVRALGRAKGRLCSALLSEIIAIVPMVYRGASKLMLYVTELFLEVYTLLEDGADAHAVKRAIFYYLHDYAEELCEAGVYESLSGAYTEEYDIVMKANLDETDYLYTYGVPVTDNMLKTAEYLKTLPEASIDAMAQTFVRGYVDGFRVMNVDFSKKLYIDLRTEKGFERITRKAIEKFEALGKKVLVNSASGLIATRRFGSRWLGDSIQAEYDHRNDLYLFMNRRLSENRYRAMQKAYECYKEQAALYAGPAVQEAYGEADFEPVNKPEVVSVDAKMSKLLVEHGVKMRTLSQQYLHREETSFTIIDYPWPSIGPRYHEIFDATVLVNTLDNDEYKRIQQHIIDVLDKASYVTVKGSGSNRTDLKIMLHPLTDPSKQTNFENCTADVNIPVGEVFTSPVLTGTEGTLHVSKVYLEGNLFLDLELRFKDGRITESSCTNFPTKQENDNYINENILNFHETLPIGEFAIGTNTTAYKMGIDFDIQAKLPILIAEKTGPHFAVGDTCYSHSEDIAVFNPDGKEIIARDNEVSALRKENPAEAYLNCHTDITIPYDELGEIVAHTADGEAYDIIRGGRFVVPGTEALNVPLDALDKKQ